MQKFSFLLALLLAFSCGKVGKPGAANDAAPSGTVIAQGAFTGLNTKTVTGIAAIYRLTDTDTYVVRLEGISAPSESGLVVIADTNTGRVLRTFLRSTLGSQNYQTSASGNSTWSSVTLFSTQTGFEYGKAILFTSKK